jgi:type IV secretory pathway VirB4 component
MMSLAEYRRRAPCLADFLPWAALVDKGVILNKDGSFQRTARFRGPDLDSATPAELVATTRPHHSWPSAPDSDQKNGTYRSK